MMRYFLFFILSSASVAQAQSLEGIWNNNEGVKAFKDERHNDAYARFAESLAQLPFSEQVHFNLGATYLVNKEYQKAIQEFGQAAKLAQQNRNSQLEFAANFNAAIAATEAKQIDRALSFYQQALEIVPDSVEAKTNIELLIQSQAQGGDGEGEQKQDQKGEGEGNEQNKDEQQGQKPDPNQPPKNGDRQNKQPRPFAGKEMSQQDVNRILEELQRQEEQVRAKFQNEKMRSAPKEKDW